MVLLTPAVCLYDEPTVNCKVGPALVGQPRRQQPPAGKAARTVPQLNVGGPFHPP